MADSGQSSQKIQNTKTTTDYRNFQLPGSLVGSQTNFNVTSKNKMYSENKLGAKTNSQGDLNKKLKATTMSSVIRLPGQTISSNKPPISSQNKPFSTKK